MAMVSSSFELESTIRGYHVYKDMIAVDAWASATVWRETGNG